MDVSKVGHHEAWQPPTFEVFYHYPIPEPDGTLIEPGFYWWDTSSGEPLSREVLHGPFGSSTDAYRDATEGDWIDID